MKHLRTLHLTLLTLLTLLSGHALGQGDNAEPQGKYVRVSPDLDIYYEEAGTGDPGEHYHRDLKTQE